MSRVRSRDAFRILVVGDRTECPDELENSQQDEFLLDGIATATDEWDDEYDHENIDEFIEAELEAQLENDCVWETKEDDGNEFFRIGNGTRCQ
jgi:hypothetical protein